MAGVSILWPVLLVHLRRGLRTLITWLLVATTYTITVSGTRSMNSAAHKKKTSRYVLWGMWHCKPHVREANKDLRSWASLKRQNIYQNTVNLNSRRSYPGCWSRLPPLTEKGKAWKNLNMPCTGCWTSDLVWGNGLRCLSYKTELRISASHYCARSKHTVERCGIWRGRALTFDEPEESNPIQSTQKPCGSPLFSEAIYLWDLLMSQSSDPA